MVSTVTTTVEPTVTVSMATESVTMTTNIISETTVDGTLNLYGHHHHHHCYYLLVLLLLLLSNGKNTRGYVDFTFVCVFRSFL